MSTPSYGSRDWPRNSYRMESQVPIVPGPVDPAAETVTFSRPPKRKRPWLALSLLGLAVVIALCAVGGALMTSGGSKPDAITLDIPASSAAATTEPTTASTTEPTKAAVAPAKPKATPKPRPTIEEGVWHVGEDIPAGTYRADESVSGMDCYWKKASDSEGDNIIANDLPTGGRPQVTLRKGQWFTTQDCGTWTKR
jgi:hypothetical protein